MPSDERVTQALRALAQPIAAYRAAVVSVTERARGHLAAGGGAPRLRAELGRFAEGRMDTGRLAEAVHGEAPLDPQARRGIQRALEALHDLTEAGDDIFVANVAPGGKMPRIAAAKLARLGRVFGAARVIELARTGAYEPPEHDAWLEEFPFDDWNRTERHIGPPLVIEVDGADLRVAALAEFVDGMQKIVIVVRGACAPAPLVRLITPGTFVMQTSDPKELARIAAQPGPAVAALTDSNAAAFVHDPAGGAQAWQRLTVSKSPGKSPAQALGALSVWEQEEELKQLVAMAQRPPGLATTGNGAHAADPAERLAAWLLERANIGSPG